MGIWEGYLDLIAEREIAKGRGKRQNALQAQRDSQAGLQNLLGDTLSTTTGTMTSNEFDAAGNPINYRSTIQKPRSDFSGGLLGSARTPEDLAKFKTGMIGLGYSGADASSAVKPIVDSIAADLTKDTKNALKRGAFKDSKEQLTAFNQMQNSFEKNIKGDRAAMTQFKSATDLVNRRGGFEKLTAQDDVALITSFAKMLRPNEAVMADDIENIMKSSGYPDMIEAFISAKGGKSLASDVRQNVYSAMTNAYDVLKPLYDQKRQQTGKLFDAAGFTKDIPRVVGDTVLGKDFAPYGGGVVAGTQTGPAAPIAPPQVAADLTDQQIADELAALRGKNSGSKRKRIGQNPRGL